MTTTSCSLIELEKILDQHLLTVVTDTDFSFSVERADGLTYDFSRGTSSLQTPYKSASTSKLVTAVIILRLVEQDYLNIMDKPQNHITDWPIESNDPLYNMTLSQLLSFTSGLEAEPLCLNFPVYNFEDCIVFNIPNRNIGNGINPGERFYYASTHLQVAGLMAVKARQLANWQDVFNDFKHQTGLFPNSFYDLPSTMNPLLAGGMHWTGDDYMNFLRALKNGDLLNPASMENLLRDQLINTTIAYSPIDSILGEEWHYGFGLWHECSDISFTCNPGERVSSAGAYGAYPFWDRTKNYFGIVARQGALGSSGKGIELERSIRKKLEAWASCI
jgi:CubicO group peptidase (beta-lactamase class C family)